MIDATGTSDIKTIPHMKDQYLTLAPSTEFSIITEGEYMTISNGAPSGYRVPIEQAHEIRDLLTHALVAHSDRLSVPV